MTGEGRSWARISEDGAYRYTLGRQWGPGNMAVFVMLNPSTADGFNDDATIRRCLAFARNWRCGGLLVLNVFAYRATEPVALRHVADPVGPENDQWLGRALRTAKMTDAPVIAAWGAMVPDEREREVLQLEGARRFRALGTTRDGKPRHPLYLKGATLPQPWPRAQRLGAA